MTVCVNCGSEVVDGGGRRLDQVYDKKLAEKSGIIKLLECERCGEYVDKYIEYEGGLVLLDLAMQQKPAFRHVLVNQNHRTSILKMVFLTLIVEGYSRWSAESSGEFFEREFEFYWKVCQSFASLITFAFTSAIITWTAHQTKLRNLQLDCGRLFTGLLLAYASRFLKLSALLWGTESTQFLWFFVDFLFFLTSMNVMKTISGLGSVQCMAVTSVSHASLHLLELF